MSVQNKKNTGNRWPKGVSGNPGGRPKGASEVRELARSHAPAAIARLRQLIDCKDPSVAVSAAKAMLDRGYGKPEQSITTDGSPLVSIMLGTGGQVIDAAQAAAAYAALCRDPSASIEGITFGAPAPAALESPGGRGVDDDEG